MCVAKARDSAGVRAPHLHPAPLLLPTVAEDKLRSDRPLWPSETTSRPKESDELHDDDAGGAVAVRTRVPTSVSPAMATATRQVLLSVLREDEETEAKAAASSGGSDNHHRQVSSRTCLRLPVLEESPFLLCLLHPCPVQIRLQRLVRRFLLQLEVVEEVEAETTTKPETVSAGVRSLDATTLSDEITAGRGEGAVPAPAGGMAEVNGRAKAAGKVAPVANSSIGSESSDNSRGETVEFWRERFSAQE